LVPNSCFVSTDLYKLPSGGEVRGIVFAGHLGAGTLGHEIESRQGIGW
jgi:hypothetical protein